MKPILFDLWGFQFFAYPLFMGLAWGIGYYRTQFQLEKRNISTRGFSKLFWGAFLFSWVGAKIFFLLNSAGGKEQEYLINSNFWLGGGFVFYGGLIFGIIYTLIYCIFFKGFKLNHLYVALPSLTYGHAVGRVGCFLAGCCYGTSCDLPWAIHLHGEFRHPVQLYESFLLLILGYFIDQLLKNNIKQKIIIITYLIGYSVLRFILEFFRGDQIRGIGVFDLSSSQLISLAFLIVFIIYLIWHSVKKIKL